MQALLDRYIARLMFVPLAATLVISALLLLLVRMAELFDLAVNQGGGGAVLRVLANLTPQYLALGIPLSLLMGVLLAFRRLALLSELDALLGVGVSYVRLLKVPMIYAVVLSALTVIVVGFVQPRSSYDHEKLLFDLNNGGLGVSIRVGEFTSLGDKMVVRAEKSRRGGRDLAGVFISTTDAEGRLLVFSAARGELRAGDDGTLLVARLFDGTVAHIERDTGVSRAAGFSSYEIPLNLPLPPQFRGRGNGEREMMLQELMDVLADPGTAPLLRQQAEAGLYRRAAQTFVLFLLPLLAIPLARPPSRTSGGLGIFLGLAVFIIYNELSLFGERLGTSGRVAPIAAQAAPFLVLAGLAAALFLMGALVPGEPPLTRLLGRLARFFRKPTLAPHPVPAQ